MLVVHLNSTLTVQFGLVNSEGEIVQIKTATVQIQSTADPAPWAGLREQIIALRAQIQAQANPQLPEPPAPLASPDAQE